MSIFLKRYHNMVITPQDDRILFDSIFDDYGLIYGGSAVMSASNKIHVGNARGFIKGSEVIIEDDDIAVELSDSGSKPGRLKIVVDYSDSSNPVKFESEVADSFPSLEQDNNINHTNGRYEVVFATYTAAETVISDVHLVMPTMQSVKEKLVALNTDIAVCMERIYTSYTYGNISIAMNTSAIMLVSIRMTVASDPVTIAIVSLYSSIFPIVNYLIEGRVKVVVDGLNITIVPNGGSQYLYSIIRLW